MQSTPQGMFSTSPQGPAAPQGMFAGAGAAPAAPGGAQAGLQMAAQLSQNPTPQMAAQIVQKLKAMGNPEADQFEQALAQTQGDPQLIKQIADAVIQQLSRGQ